MAVSRRRFLVQAGAATLGFGGLAKLAYVWASTDVPSRTTDPGFGPLNADPEGVLDLTGNLRYRVIARSGEALVDGFRLPGKPDGMAAFAGPNGKTIVVCNHEVNVGDEGNGPFGDDNALLKKLGREQLFDYGRGRKPGLGGTSTFVFDPATQQIERHHLSLAGTIRNCAGGPTPWGSWLTCEETVLRADDDLEHDHGWVFEVPAAAKGLVTPRPIKAMGRFNHEATATNPANSIVYLTEDTHDSLLYRYIPNVPGKLHEGGKLQALVVRDRPSLDTRNWEESTVKPGTPMAVRWIDLDEVEAPQDDLRLRGFAQGAARFARGEGMWWGNDSAYFACTNGGRHKVGQVFRYIPSPAEGTPAEDQQPGTLELFIEPNDRGLIDKADNLTVAPWGDVVLCEDGGGQQFVVGVTPEGGIYKIARNAVSDSEMAGVCFSPDGSTMFLNIMHDGLTVAITGDWEKARSAALRPAELTLLA